MEYIFENDDTYIYPEISNNHTLNPVAEATGYTTKPLQGTEDERSVIIKR